MMIIDPRYKAISFDVDDTILHTHITRAKLNRWLSMASREFGADESMLNDTTKIFVETCKLLIKEGKCLDFKEAMDMLTDRVNEIASIERDEPIAVEGLFEMLMELRNKGYKLAILTNGFREYLKGNVKKFSLEKYFDVIIGFNDLPFGSNKPNPESVLILAERLGVKPEEILHIGDGIEDYQCAIGAGAGFVGVTTGCMSREDWKSISSDIVVIEKSSDLLD